jgi:hypothetical protein
MENLTELLSYGPKERKSNKILYNPLHSTVATLEPGVQERRHGRLIARRGSSSGEAQPEPFHRSVVAVEAFPEGEQVIGLGGRADRGGVGDGTGWALLR